MKKIRNWFLKEVLAGTEDVFVRAKMELLFNYAVAFFILGCLYYIYLFFNGLHYHFYLISFTVLTLGSVPFVLKFTGSLKAASNWYVIQQFFVSAGSAFIQQGKMDMSAGFWIMNMVLAAFFLYNRKWGIIIIILFMAVGGLVGSLKGLYFIPPNEQLAADSQVFLMPCLLDIYIVWMYIKTREEAQRKINAQKNLLEEKNKEVMDSIHYAKRIQNSLMPSEKYIARMLKKLNGSQ